MQRRTALVTMGMAAVAGCARAVMPELPSTDLTAEPVRAANRLRVAIFEIEDLDLPFHAALIIHAGDRVLIYDPAGHWESETCARDVDLIRDPSPTDVEAFLNRTSDAILRIGWTLHLFETAVSPEVAQRAIVLAETAPPSPPMHCAFEVGTLLSQLDGFEFVSPGLITADLLRALRAQPGIGYSRRMLADRSEDG